MPDNEVKEQIVAESKYEVIEWLRAKVRSRADRVGRYGTAVPDVSILCWLDEAERECAALAEHTAYKEKGKP